MVNTAPDGSPVNPGCGGKSDSSAPTRPGWFHRCRHTGELQWVPASAVPESAQASISSRSAPGAATGRARSIPTE
jgi:hypothetical protein